MSLITEHRHSLQVARLRQGQPATVGVSQSTVPSHLVMVRSLSVLGTVLVVWALIALLRASNWDSDRFGDAIRQNPTIGVVGLLGLGMELAGALTEFLT